jgi:hypothetical protein
VIQRTSTPRVVCNAFSNAGRVAIGILEQVDEFERLLAGEDYEGLLVRCHKLFPEFAIDHGLHPARPDKKTSTTTFLYREPLPHAMLAGTNPPENILIFPHNVVTVPVAGAVYVIGQVRKPGEVAVKGNAIISVPQALSSAEGFGLTPAPQHAKIVRSVPGSTELKEIPVDLKKVMPERLRTLPCGRTTSWWYRPAVLRRPRRGRWKRPFRLPPGSSYGAIFRS